MSTSKEVISSMTAPDIRNELEANGLSTAGNKNELVQRLYSFRKGKQTPYLAASFTSPPLTSSPVQLREEVRGLVEKVNEREKEIDQKISEHFEKLSKQLMLFVGSHVQNDEAVHGLDEGGCDLRPPEDSSSLQVSRLIRKLKMHGTSIEMMFGEIEQLEKIPDARIEMHCTLRRLNTLEENYGSTVQEIIALMSDETAVDEEIRKWANFQQEILRISRKAENYIKLKQEKESQHECKSQGDETRKFCSGVNHLRLPKFTLPEFSGDILEWVTWWDQFKTCIHENDTLGDRERFNYLLMYVKGAAKRAIEYIEVTSENYARAIEALQKRYGRKRIVVEHLIDSILSIEKKDKVNAQSLRYLYDTMVNRYHTLESYEPNLKHCHRIMVPILQSKLPQAVRRKWEYELSKIENEEDDKKITVEYFFNFMRSHVMSEEASETSHASSQHSVLEERRNNPQRPGRTPTRTDRIPSSSAIALNSTSKREDVKQKISSGCVFCEKSHDSSNCYMIQRKSVPERLQLIKEKKLCFNCLHPVGPNHNSATCKRPGCLIEGCNKKHHVLLHRVLPDNSSDRKEVQDTSSSEITAHSGLLTGSITAHVNNQERLLPTALAKLHANDKDIVVRVLVDCGSDHSYIRNEIAEALNLTSNGSPKTMTIFMHGGQSRSTKVKNVNFQVSNIHDDRKKINLSAWSVSSVCAPLQPIQVDLSRYNHLKGLNLADKFPREASTIDVLIGADQWSQIMLNGIRKGPMYTPFAMNSIFGWLLSGCTGSTSHKDSQHHKSITNYAVVRLEDDLNESTNFSLKKFWELESIGITDQQQKKEMSGEENDALQQFHSTISFDGERYEVGLPWKRDHPELASNYQQALRRMLKVERALHEDERKEEMYKEAMQQYFKDGHAREITEEDQKIHPVYYLPHHPIIREDKTTTKCRVVFDASARNQQGMSLNDCLLPGPALQPNLVSILIRFRLHRIAIMADLRKMFLQIKLASKDQNCHRFIWRERPDEDPKVYCMTRVTFGVVSSPFQAIATVQHHATVNKDEFPKAAKEIKENMYVDDLLSGEQDINKTYVLYQDLYALMKKGGFELVKWYTNSKEMLDLIEPEIRGPTTLVPISREEESLKALGVFWNTKDDTFLFNQGEKLSQAQDEGTKRSLISLASKLFDPLGFIGPFTIRAKIMFQQLWSKGIQWDESLDEEINIEWQKWKEELKSLKELEVPRCFYAELDKVTEVQLHGFCDASTKAYGAAVYIRCKDNKDSTRTHLVMAKSKVAPTKRISLPRLELLAAYILAKLMKFVLDSLTINVQDMICWSDSQVVLAWISQSSQKWKVFVANRVQEIQEIIPPEQWQYCPGQSNPADLLTRGESLSSLIHNKTWWSGPEWLAESRKKWPTEKNSVPSLEDLRVPQRNMLLSEAKKMATTMTSTESFQLEDRFETWQKLVRVTAWILKWLRLHGRPKLGYLSADEIKDAEHTLIKRVQKNAFPDEMKELEEGKQVPKTSRIVKLDPKINRDLLVVGGRLQFALIPEEAKHQVILPQKNTLTEKLVLHIHCKANHAGPETTLGIIRQRFWPLQGRREVKRILRKCLICKHWRTIPTQQKMAPLPLERVQIVPPFTNIGLDFTGPLYLKVKGETTLAKAYICIFVCEDTRAVHLELTNNMSTEEFLQAYKRMVSRRGVPKVIRSDNQTTFHKAARVFKISKQKSKLANINPKEVANRLANDNVTWKFITERASHRAGHWERVCRQIKEPLRRVLGKALLTYTEMYTVLTSIEATINSRPLTFIGDDIRDGRVITPALLAIGRDLGSVPDIQLREVPLDERYYYQQQLQNHFWDRWMREYLPSLTVRKKWTQEMTPLKENDVVLITDDNVTRGQWRLGKVVQTFPGTDGLIRTARIQTKRGLVNRPVQRLHLLEEYKVSQCPSSAVQVPQHSRTKSNPNKRRNGSSPLKGEDVPARSKFGRPIKRPSRYK